MSMGFRKGFTLIELALVAALMAVIIGLSAPLFKEAISNLSANNAALTISKLINYAQERAIIERRYYRIRFYPGGRYRLSASDESDDVTVYKNIPGKFGRIFSLPRELSIACSAEEMTLYPDGTCDEFWFSVVGRYGRGYLVSIRGFGTNFDMREIGIEKK